MKSNIVWHKYTQISLNWQCKLLSLHTDDMKWRLQKTDILKMPFSGTFSWISISLIGISFSGVIMYTVLFSDNLFEWRFVLLHCIWIKFYVNKILSCYIFFLWISFLWHFVSVTFCPVLSGWRFVYMVIWPSDVLSRWKFSSEIL